MTNRALHGMSSARVPTAEYRQPLRLQKRPLL